MKLLTKELEKKIPPLYSQENVKDPMVVAKFFFPAGSATWWITEGSWVESNKEKHYLMFGLCMLFTPQEAELGYMNLTELQTLKVNGLGVERDMYWEPVPLSKVKERLGI